jgi:hypothetical protein
LASTHTTSSIDVAVLRRAVRGSVMAPGDDGWDAARTPWNVACEQWKSEKACFNFAEQPADRASFYPEATHDRLREIRERFDSSELFRANQRIQPAGSDW